MAAPAISHTARIVDALGGPAIVGRRVRGRYQLAERLREGLPYSAFESLLKKLDVRRGTLAAILHLPSRTLARRKRAGLLAPVESNQVFRLARVFAHAVEVFGDPQKAAEWFRRRNQALGGQAPLALMDTDIGVQEVDDILGRIEHGIFS
jgi:putative toxin-antitoxin system antitoxin component (TIGR02293 family)